MAKFVNKESLTQTLSISTPTYLLHLDVSKILISYLSTKGISICGSLRFSV